MEYNDLYQIHNFKTGDKLLASQMNKIEKQLEINTAGLLFVTPEMFGAIGNGDSENPTDDTIAIQKAINTGKSVKFSPKTYLITSPIILDQNTDSEKEDKRIQRKGLVYDGGGCTILHKNCAAVCLTSAIKSHIDEITGKEIIEDISSNSIGYKAFIQLGLVKCIIQNFNFIYDGDTKQDGLYIAGDYNLNNSYINQCKIISCSFKGQNRGIYLSGYNISIEKCIFENCNYGILSNYINQSTIKDNRLVACQNGLKMICPIQSVISNNYFYGCGTLSALINEETNEPMVDENNNIKYNSNIEGIGLFLSGNLDNPNECILNTLVINNTFKNGDSINPYYEHIKVTFAINLTIAYNILDGYTNINDKAIDILFCKNLNMLYNSCLINDQNQSCDLYICDTNSNKKNAPNGIWKDIEAENIYIDGGYYGSINISYGENNNNTNPLSTIPVININNITIQGILKINIKRPSDTTDLSGIHFVNAKDVIINSLMTSPSSEETGLFGVIGVSYLKNANITLLDEYIEIKTIGDNRYSLTKDNDNNLHWTLLED